ncbi:ArsI/CadI family heavy metal resistance metalloenzyme [Shouchella clausii]|uniref:Lactoylglutathione lyase n=1 Tax=Shouchella clausii (strain KSM-K16) TaxID=66692 RepID=Q5WJT2_SHOC1|nr:ArsI/CadI family heavy metal resistance metalloenzyme [Shouchella clausii]PAD16005.1 glyoxalase/bleomycin resistance/dioxygenase family protein [Shouchella clausii]BAD63373.1 lactoylglutathione lyase [Shouchella clausii KSM-K16]GIN08726.1 lactoylglutathione lyase [Shouchella clausii]
MVNVHIGLNVKNISESQTFYKRFLGVKPVKVKDDYVKFLTQEPNLNLTLTQRNKVAGNQINHLGIQVETKEDVLKHKERLEREGFFAREELNTTCCYAVQDKFWVTDPDGNEWEYFYTKQDSE